MNKNRYMNKNRIKSTTIVGIRKDNLVVIAGDGQASLGNTVMKSNSYFMNNETKKKAPLGAFFRRQFILLFY